MTQKALLPLIFLLLLIGCAGETATPSPAPTPTAAEPTADPAVVRVCDDVSEWPPYTYFERVNGEKGEQVIGFVPDVLAEIFDKNGVAYEIELLPWQRCVEEVERGKDYQMLMNASYNEERAEKYYLSEQVYVTNSYYFYSKTHHPEGLDIEDKSDLKNYRTCGILGYNYTEYDVPEIDTGTTDMNALVDKLAADRCDLFIEKFEPMVGFAVVGNDYLTRGNLGYAPIVGTEPAAFYMLFTKNERGLELKNMVDAGLKEMQESGRLAELLAKYVGE